MHCLRRDGAQLARKWDFFSFLLIVAAASSTVASAAVVEDAGRRKLEVEVGSQSIHIHSSGSRKSQGGSGKASKFNSAVEDAVGDMRRGEEVSNIIRRAATEGVREDMTSQVEPPVAQMMFRQNAASQDGAQPFFVGSWNGHRNNWYGDVGISFVPQVDFTIVSLGRHYHNETHITETVPVTLWSVETKTALAIVNVGPQSFKEGHYVWEPVEAPGVPVSQGREYRLTQACTPGMRDKWFDETLPYDDIVSNAATGFARFKGGVNFSGFGYPVSENGQFRRAGMVNFKMAKPPTHIIEGGAPRGAEICRVMISLCLFVLLVGLKHP
jgi:hypothetical protein|mmetsp:Transcript_6948/g.11201  ORF Transcript_6948/g.11201 Transcript_6948/m.11201 type:complete len:326 (-) Transcript_6948:19-996(-)